MVQDWKAQEQKHLSEYFQVRYPVGRFKTLDEVGILKNIVKIFYDT